jgi:methyl-accepting chemotaxis protein
MRDSAMAKILKAKETMDIQKMEMNAFLENAQHIVNSSKELSSLSDVINQGIGEAAAHSENGKTSMNKLMKEMQSIRESSSHLMDKVETLSSLSSELVKMIQSLQNISRQTNLLALNASIEAARAGAAGRGFDVVAKEIRKLSEESADATKQAQTSISSILGEIDEIKTTSQLENKQTDLGIQRAQETEQLFSLISQSVEAVAKQKEELGHVTSKMEQMSREANSLSRSISQNREVIAQGLEVSLDEYSLPSIK